VKKQLRHTQAALRRLKLLQARAERSAAWIAGLRLLSFLVATAFAFSAWYDQALTLYGPVAGAGALIFLGAVYLHRRPYERLPRLQSRLNLHQDRLARLQRKTESLDLGEDLYSGAPVEAELQLFGRGGVWPLLSRARLPQARRRLAQLLSMGAPKEELESRQEAAAELKLKQLWCHRLECAARRVEADPKALEALLCWAEAPPRRWVRLLARFGAFWVLLTWISILLASLGYNSPWRPLLLVQLLIFLFSTRSLSQGYLPLLGGEGQCPLLALREMFQILERGRFQASLLKKLQGELGTIELRPSRRMMRLSRALDSLAARDSALTWGFANIAGLWELWASAQLERWREEAGDRLRSELEILAEFEVLSSMASFAREQPNFTWPKLRTDGPLLEAKALGHPLFRDELRRYNDFSLPLERLFLITGSNMSGKSSFLRTVGLNLRLAQAGASVCAQALSFRACQISSSVQVQDDPEAGLSRFYAEVKRIRQVLDELKESQESGQIRLFLVDEMLSGTNSYERHQASRGVVRQLLRWKQAAGLVTTHDLDLVNLKDDHPDQILLGHFSDRFDGEALHFDYQLKPGMAQSSNALLVLKMEGIQLD